jgi:hypothetical protein
MRRRVAMVALAVVLLTIAGGFAPARSALGQAPPGDVALTLVAELGARATAVALDGSIAWTGMSDRLASIDVADPTKPRLVAKSDRLGGEVRSVAVDAGHAFAVLGQPGLRIVDVRDPAAPRIVGTLDTPGDAGDVAVAGGMAYIADGTGGMRVIDVHDPAAPREVGVARSPRPSLFVASQGAYAYVAQRDAFETGVAVVDVADPAHPREVGFVDVPGGGYPLAVKGSRVYAGRWPATQANGQPSGYIAVVDVSTPARPRLTGTSAHAASGPSSAPRFADAVPAQDVPRLTTYLHDLIVDGDRVYVTAGYTSEIGHGGIPIWWTEPSGQALGVYAYNIATDPDRPVQFATFFTPGDALGLAASSPMVFVADGRAGLQAVSFDLAAEGHALGAYESESLGPVAVLTATTDRLYAVDRQTGLQVVDVSTPDRPAILWHYRTRSRPADVVVAGHYAFIALEASYGSGGSAGRPVGGLETVFLDQVNGPVHGGDGAPSANAGAVSLNGDEALLASARGTHEGVALPGIESGLHVVDVSRPLAPRERRTFVEPVEAIDVAVWDAKAYVTDHDRGLWVIDVSDPRLLLELGFAATGGEGWAVAVADGFALVADGTAGLTVVDVRDPRSPTRVTGLALPGAAVDVTVAGGLAYVACGTGGIQVVDVRNPRAPVVRTAHVPPGSVDAVAVAGDYVHAGLAEGVIQVLRREARSSPTPIPSVVATPTMQATPTPTATVSPATTPPTPETVTPTVSPTAGSSPGRVFLPITYAQRS